MSSNHQTKSSTAKRQRKEVPQCEAASEGTRALSGAPACKAERSTTAVVISQDGDEEQKRLLALGMTLASRSRRNKKRRRGRLETPGRMPLEFLVSSSDLYGSNKMKNASAAATSTSFCVDTATVVSVSSSTSSESRHRTSLSNRPCELRLPPLGKKPNKNEKKKNKTPTLLPQVERVVLERMQQPLRIDEDGVVAGGRVASNSTGYTAIG